VALFGEGPGRFVVGGDPAAIEALVRAAAGQDLPASVIGSAGGEAVRIAASGVDVALSLDRAVGAWNSLADAVAAVPTAVG
jgi:hypothetical protein